MNTPKRRHRPRPIASDAAPKTDGVSDEVASTSIDTAPTADSDVPEAKPIESLELQFAGPLRRMYAFAIDVGILLMVIFMVAPISGGRVFSPQAGVIDVFIFLAYFIIPTGLFGRTIGKWVAGISVVDENGHKPGVAVAIPREMVGRFVATIAFGIGIIWIFFDKNHQGWHDKMAGTYVVTVPNTGGPGFLARLLTTQQEDETKSDQRRERRVGRPRKRNRRRNRKRR